MFSRPQDNEWSWGTRPDPWKDYNNTYAEKAAGGTGGAMVAIIEELAQGRKSQDELNRTLVKSLQGKGDQQDKGIRKLAAKANLCTISGESDEKLFEELLQFEIDVGDIGTRPGTYEFFAQFRAQLRGDAKTTVEYELMKEPAKTFYETAMSTKDPAERAEMWNLLFAGFVHRFKCDVNLTVEKQIDLAEKGMKHCKMHGEGAGPARKFVKDLKRGRLGLARAKITYDDPDTLAALHLACEEENRGNVIAKTLIKMNNHRMIKEMSIFYDKLSPKLYEHLKRMEDTKDEIKTVDGAIEAILQWAKWQKDDRDSYRYQGMKPIREVPEDHNDGQTHQEYEEGEEESEW